jgi:hypothetical protein
MPGQCIHLLLNSGGVCQRDRIGRTTLLGIRVEKDLGDGKKLRKEVREYRIG